MARTSSFAADLRCPDDGHVLVSNQQSAIAFAACRHCDGAWFSREAIEAGVARATLPTARDRKVRMPPAGEYRRCPQCTATLNPEDVDGVIIDVCATCGGVWIDPGEYPAARKRIARIRREREMPSMRQKKGAAKFVERVVDFVGSVLIERADDSGVDR